MLWDINEAMLKETVKELRDIDKYHSSNSIIKLIDLVKCTVML